MRAIQYTRSGPAEVLELIEKNLPEVPAGHVRVRIAVSGVNPTDWKARLGSGSSEQLPHPKVPNQDGAGTVDAVGAGVVSVSIGTRVWVWDAAFERDEGTAQEFVVLPEHQVVALSDGGSFDVGASLGIPALTAHRALTSAEDGPEILAPNALHNTIVLVTGGAGAVGHAAIQLAVWAGATVITTISSDAKAELAKRAGAHHVINYRTEDVVTRIREIAPAGVATIVEVNAIANIESDVEVIARGGTIAIYTSDENPTVPVPVRASMTKNIRIQFVLTYTTSESQKRNAVAAVAAAERDGALQVGESHGLPLTRFPLAETAAAHRAVEQDTVGKVLIDIGAH